tara:strand:- start:2672 stop:3091 length:420 start_codon:yes stop_codon:yes gene_type:complete
MILKVKKLSEKAVIPTYARNGDACMDLHATSVDKTHELFYQYGTDIAMEIPRGYVGLIFPRSSISKTNHSLRNSVGVIDSGYRGEILIRMSQDKSRFSYQAGDRVAQLMIIETPWVDIEEVDELSISSREENGFGSTGR